MVVARLDDDSVAKAFANGFQKYYPTVHKYRSVSCFVDFETLKTQARTRRGIR